MASIVSEADRASSLLAGFEAAGAEAVSPDCLQPAALLLDVYGENIRARAYTTQDPLDGEVMLRPDFTVPVAQAHITSGKDRARYAYAGPVWRRQVPGSARGRESWQAGFEVLGEADAAKADAEVFAVIARAVAGSAARAKTGDLGFIFAAIAGLQTTDARKAALTRHVWRPRRFARLLDRFCGKTPFDCDTRPLPAMPTGADLPGRRGAADIAHRIEALKDERNTAPLSLEEAGLFDSLATLEGPAQTCLSKLEDLAKGFSALAGPCKGMAKRLDALAEQGFEPSGLHFDGAFGRQTMEYYDGFVFAFEHPADGPAIAQGGRYDALAALLNGRAPMPAVGGIVRPAVLAQLEAADA